MKTNTRFSIVAALFVWLLTFSNLHAATVTVYDSVVSLATNLTKNYTFTDGISGQSVTMAVTMSPYAGGATATFSILDGNTRVAVNGNLIVQDYGVTFAASLISASSGVLTNSIKFGVAGLGIRPVDGGGKLNWASSATALTSISYSTNAEVLQALDAGCAPLNYTAQLTNNSTSSFQLSDVFAPGQSVMLAATFNTTADSGVDPRTNSWFTTYSSQYARIYTNDLARTNGISITAWTNGNTIQKLPAYCGIQEIYSSSNYVYVRSTGLASYVMGAWYANAMHTMFLQQYPTNQQVLFRIPRSSTVPTKKILSGGGAVGIFVDGVAMYNNWDANFWNGSADVSQGGTNGFWNRDAFVNEGVSFDAGYAHQPPDGQYHYHADPLGLRYELGDHVDFNPVTKIYSESTNTPTKHSPILGWAADGFPIYGPYGYSISNDASSGIRRMISGYVPRNGQYGTDNYSTNGALRKYIPQWAARLYGKATNILSGPVVSSSYTFGRYMEDNDYLGDHGYVQGKDFDLDEYNGRWCVTPEFPGGTYAYFVAINSNGVPVYPYDLGFGYYGNPNGGNVSVIADTVVTNFLGGTNSMFTLDAPTVKNGTVTLSWSAVEGGSYQVEATTNLADSSWTVLQSGVSPNKNSGGYTNLTSFDQQFYRVARTGVANFDSAGTTTFAVSSYAPGGSASRGQTVQITITLSTGSGNPPMLPPAGAPISSVTLGGISGTGISDTTQGVVVATFVIPSNASTGAQTITVNFANSGPTFTVNSFTIN